MKSLKHIVRVHYNMHYRIKNKTPPMQRLFILDPYTPLELLRYDENMKIKVRQPSFVKSLLPCQIIRSTSISNRCRPKEQLPFSFVLSRSQKNQSLGSSV